ncbi:hypothetical protein L6452_08152 [Arctium lappa]|uniref:Uncharacterized protein n=1 Tax=Arctium lappa TaxID=4217 RepID=A0ACB9DGZ8_ARCLA|nr:hypothetical protein L6452_08152 [Arctium lappa]
MDQIVGAIVTPVVDSLMVRVKKHLRYLISCPKYVRDMRTKMEKLKTTRLGVEGDMNYNNSNSLEVPKEVDPWLEKVRMIDTQVETIPIDVGGCFNLKVRHKLGREAFKIIQDIDISMEEKASIKWTNNPITLAQVDSTKASTSSIPFRDYNDFKSRETTYMKAFNALKADSKPHMIALCGMGGVGKTIMTKSLKKVCMYLFIDSGIVKSLVKLEELYMRSVRRKVNAEGDELVECSKNLHGLEIEFFEEDALPQNMSYKNLKRFRISFGCRLDKNFVRSRYSMENTLMLVNNEYEQPLDSGMNELFEKTQVLYLQVTGIKDFGGGLWASSLQNLRVLHICKCKDLRYLFTIRVANGLKQLEHLKISKCPVLETLVADSDYEISEEKVITFSALKFLSLEGLPMLTSLCKVGNVIELPQLEELILDNLPNFTSIYQHFLKKEAMSTKLKKLDIDNLEKLKEIWPSQLSSNDQVISSQLTVIQVEGCDSLVNLFPCNPMSLLHHLEELTVKYCGSIDVIFNIDLGSSSSSSCVVAEIEEDINSSNLRSIKAWRCWELRQVWKVKGVNDDLPIPGFQNLECIEIRECNRLRNLFTPTTSNFDMKALTKVYINGDHEARNLHTLTISGFTRLEVMFETQQKPISTLFPNLTSITLESCNRIKYLFSPRMAKLLSNLKSIIIGDCHAIEEVVSNIDNEYEEIATSISPHTNTTFFPHLDILHLYHLKSLKRIDGVGANRLTSVTATSIHDKFQNQQLYNTSMCSTSDIIHLLQFPWSFSNLIEVDVDLDHELSWKKTIFPSIDELVKVENVGEAVAADKVVFEGRNNETQSADDDGYEF